MTNDYKELWMEGLNGDVDAKRRLGMVIRKKGDEIAIQWFYGSGLYIAMGRKEDLIRDAAKQLV